MVRRRGQRDALEVRPLFLIVEKENQLFADVNDEAAEHRFDSWRKRVEFFKREGERDLLFDANWVFHVQFDLFALLKSNGIGSEVIFPNQKRSPFSFSRRYRTPTLLHRFLRFPPSPGLKFSTLKGHNSKWALSQIGAGNFLISSAVSVCPENEAGFSSRAIQALSVFQNQDSLGLRIRVTSGGGSGLFNRWDSSRYSGK